jgi:hypothetical protein
MSIPNGIKVARNGVEMGEYLPEAIPVLLSSGTLLPTDNYWKPGMSGWLLLSQFPMPQGAPPAMPYYAPPLAPKKGAFGRIAWMVGGFFMPYLSPGESSSIRLTDSPAVRRWPIPFGRPSPFVLSCCLVVPGLLVIGLPLS